MANPRKVDVSEDRPAEEQEAIQDVDKSTLKGPTEAQQDKVSIPDNQYRREQLLENSNVLVGAPSWLVEVALAGDDRESLTIAQAQKAVDAFNKKEVETS